MGVGYPDTQYIITTLLWNLLIIFKADLISSKLANPVERITGFFIFAISVTNFKSVISNEEILYIGGLNLFKKLSDLKLKGVLNKFIFLF